VGGKPPRTRQHVHFRHPGTELNDRKEHERPLVKALAPVGIVMTLGADPLVIELVDSVTSHGGYRLIVRVAQKSELDQAIPLAHLRLLTEPAESTEDAWRAS